MIDVKSFECGPVATMTYLVTNTDIKKSVVIDVPPESMEDLIGAVAALDSQITDVLLTHTHWDHTVDLGPLVKKTGASVYVHQDDLYRLLDPMRHTIWPLPFEMEKVVPNEIIEEGDVINVIGLDFRVLHTPGHTEGGVCFVDHKYHRVFVGDTLFKRSIGRTDLPGGDTEKLIESIRSKLFTLPDHYVAMPGHGPVTTIGDEKLQNPFVGMDQS